MTKDYTASTTANVISTAGDAHAQRDRPEQHGARATWSTASFALPQAAAGDRDQPRGQRRRVRPVGQRLAADVADATPYPVSNDPVAIDFKQSIAAGDALRTGNYSKTLTYTLSTTQP